MINSLVQKKIIQRVYGKRHGERSNYLPILRYSVFRVGFDSSPVTWYVPHEGNIQKVEIVDSPQPLALYELVYPLSLPRAGQLYRIVMYKALLPDPPMIFSKDEVSALIGLKKEQVVLGINRKPSLRELLNEGALIIEGDDKLDLHTRIYPIGTPLALARIFYHIDNRNIPQL